MNGPRDRVPPPPCAECAAGSAILKAVAREFPDAIVDEQCRVHADPDLTRDQARAVARSRLTRRVVDGIERQVTEGRR